MPARRRREAARPNRLPTGRKAAADDAVAAQDRFVDDRRTYHLPVQHDGKPSSSIFGRRLAEPTSADGIEAETHDRPVVLKGRLGIQQRFATDDHPLADDVKLDRLSVLGRAGVGQKLRPGRHPTLKGVLDQRLFIDQLEGQSCRAPDQLLDPLRIIDARQLNQDAVLALTLDVRLFGAGFVDPSADDLDRLGEDAIAQNGQLSFLNGNAMRLDAESKSMSTGSPKAATTSRARSASPGSRKVNPTEPPDTPRSVVGDSRRTQLGAQPFFDRAQPLFDDLFPVDPEKQVRPALQIKSRLT